MSGCLQTDTLRCPNPDPIGPAANLARGADVVRSHTQTSALAPGTTAHVITAHVVTVGSLRTLPIFADTPEASLQTVVRASMLRHVPRNVQVVRAGLDKALGQPPGPQQPP